MYVVNFSSPDFRTLPKFFNQIYYGCKNIDKDD